MSVKITNIASATEAAQEIEYLIMILFRQNKISKTEYFNMMHEVDKMKIIINDLLIARQIK